MLHSGSLLAKLIPGTCVTASKLPHSVESSRLQDGFVACCWYNSRDTRPVRTAIQNRIIGGYAQGDGQSNDNSTAMVPTAVYWRLERILKPSNLNGSSFVTSLSPHPPLCPPSAYAAQTFLSLRRPWVPSAHGPRRSPAQQHFSSSASVLGFGCSRRGLYWRVISWIEISFQSIQQRSIKAHTVLWGAVISTLPHQWQEESDGQGQRVHGNDNVVVQRKGRRKKWKSIIWKAEVLIAHLGLLCMPLDSKWAQMSHNAMQ